MGLKAVFDKMRYCTDCEICSMNVNIFDPQLGNGKLEGWGKGRIMFVAQNPSVYRCKNCLTPVDDGISKEFVDTLISLGLPAEHIYFTNVVKCSTPVNRVPEFDEINQCMKWLKKEIRYIKPLLLVGVGRVARDSLIASTYEGIPIMGVQHPSYIERTGGYKEYSKQLKEVISVAWEKLGSRDRGLMETKVRQRNGTSRESSVRSEV